MTPTVEMKPLSQKKRRFVFFLSLALFLFAVPFSVFYAIGYRFDFTSELTSIKSVGGLYVRNDTDATEIFVNNEPVRDMRVFQRAAYIQNLEAGMHRLHVQGNNVQTWVKNLPVYAHFVTEVASFNMPQVPQIRIITQWNNPLDGRGVVFDAATSTAFDFASSTTALHFASSSTATSSLIVNPEYAYVASLIASSTEMQMILNGQEKEPFRFDTEQATSVPLLDLLAATTTRSWRDLSLYENEGEIYISWNGNPDDVPYYYCVIYQGEKKTSSEYGKHVTDALLKQFKGSSNLSALQGERVCRSDIRIDRLGKEVLWFDFFPDSGDLVLLHLEDGLYVVEVDDRAWQNTQLLYPGEDIHVVQDGGRIYVKDGEYYVEVFTEIASQQ